MRLVGRDQIPGALAVLSLVALSAGVTAATLPPGFQETSLASGLARPTAMALAPDGRIFVCQQGGQLRVIRETI